MHVKHLIVLGLIIALFSCVDKASTQVKIENRTNEIYRNLVDIRRDINQNAELSGQEIRTSKIVTEYLLSLGLDVHTNIGGYGVVGILNGDKKGKKIAWRADMDAVKYAIVDSVTHTQNEVAKHTCGHDVHTTIGLGIANVLSLLKEDINGTIYFIFQPAEETFTGAKAMINDGLFDIIHPDEIYALHIFPSTTGNLSIKANELFAYEKTLSVNLKISKDTVGFKSFLKQRLQKLVRNKINSSPWSLEHLTDSELGLENQNTIYDDYFILLPPINTKFQKDEISFKSTFFETNKDSVDSYLTTIKNDILRSEFKDVFVSLNYSRGNPTLVNNVELTQTASKSINKRFGKNTVKPIYGQVPYFNEDFIYFQQRVPGVLFFLGGTTIDDGLMAMPHSNDFAVNEKAIDYGINYFSSLLIDSVNSKND